MKKAIFFDQMSALSLAAAELVCQEARKAASARGRFFIALSGGSTPRELYQLLSQDRFRRNFPWDQTDFFWSDERCVPPDHADSNYRMAAESLLSKTTAQKHRIHRIEAETPDTKKTAANYEIFLREFFSSPKQEKIQNSEFFSFDLTLLGVGPDGHTASIFPKSPAQTENKHWVLPVPAPEGILPRVPRITLTFPILNASRKVLFLASQPGKEKVLTELLGPAPDSDYPAGQVQAREEIFWYIQGKPDSRV